jgi:hypothetical protein
LLVGVERAAAHPDKPDVERDGERVQVAATRLDRISTRSFVEKVKNVASSNSVSSRGICRMQGR